MTDPFFPGFRLRTLDVPGGILRVRTEGSGPHLAEEAPDAVLSAFGAFF